MSTSPGTTSECGASAPTSDNIKCLFDALVQIAAFSIGEAEDRRAYSRGYTQGFNNAGVYASGIARHALAEFAAPVTSKPAASALGDSSWEDKH